ncbi:uncharacterized protein BXIN_0023 [Babesia sp. Xinjiang]|uniref:uncharacterized protein n=1 Tax=Babesia sp. Xinjiang TaxID=462227 RepID=UPI000A2607D8|nr:uncharacterized protein BXIN_0023 [Babesia sp. Xinjiang]ORM39755.1 hypothetical protein BXIN_0023 [Babesia sp. Xinjiang]
MSLPVRVKEERVSVSHPTRLPDPAALVCSKLTSCPYLSVRDLISGSDAERAEKTQLLILQLSRCHQTEHFNLASDASDFCALLRSVSNSLQVKVCELLVAYIKAVYVDTHLLDNDEGIRSSESLLDFYRILHNDIVEFALPNVRAGDQCALFICNLISICSSRKVFAAIVDLFSRSVRDILTSGGDGTPRELAADHARRVIGMMKALLFLTKAFGTPTAPSAELCSIASSVITSTKTHMCRLYSYNVIAFLLRDVSSQDAIKDTLPNLTASQLKHVVALMKEANHVVNKREWSFQHTPPTPPAPVMSTPIISQPPLEPSVETVVRPTLPLQDVLPCSPNEHIPTVSINEASAVAATVTPLAVRRDVVSVGVSFAAATNVTAAVSDVPRTLTGTYTQSIVSVAPSTAPLTAHSTRSPTRPTSPELTQESSAHTFKNDWYKMLSMQFSYSGQGSTSSSYDREAWKAKNQALTAVVEHVQRMPSRMTMGTYGTQIVEILENILKFESAIPIILGALRLLALLLEKCGEGIIRHLRSSTIFDLVFERLKDTNSKVQGVSIETVAWLIKYGDGTVVLEAIKRSLGHKSPQARIAMCNIICGAVKLPEEVGNISQELQCHNSQLIPLLSSMVSDKNVKVRNAAMECKRALEDINYVPARASSAKVDPLRATRTLSVPAPAKTRQQSLQAANRRTVSAEESAAHLDSPTGKSTAVVSRVSDVTDQPAGPTSSTAPVKRKLVRRFLKNSIRKKSDDNKVPTSRPSSNATPSDEPFPTGPSNVMDLDVPVPVEGRSASVVSSGVTESTPSSATSAPFTQKDSMQCDVVQSSPALVSHVTQDSTAASATVDFRSYIGSATSNYAVEQPPSAAEAALSAHVPDTIINKVARRGTSRRGFAEGLYELSKWLQGHLDLADLLKDDIIQFINDCTNGFREYTKTGRAALYSFLEDFVSYGICGDSVKMVVLALSSEITNPKVASLLKQLAPGCDVDSLVSMLLDANKGTEDTSVRSAILNIFCEVLTPDAVAALNTTTVSTIVDFCLPISGSPHVELSRLSERVLDLLDAVPSEGENTMQVDTPESAASPQNGIPMNTAQPLKVTLPTPDQVTTPQIEEGPYTPPSTSDKTAANSEGHISPSSSSIPATAPVCDAPVNAQSFFVLADRFSNEVAAPPLRLEGAVSSDLYASMFESSQDSSLERACLFWETFLHQPTDLLHNVLSGENVRFELLTWLCQTLLRGTCERVILRCLDHLFGKVKEMGNKLSVEEASMIIDSLGKYHDRSPGDALIAFDHLLQVINVTEEIIASCSSHSVWRDVLPGHVASPLLQQEAIQPLETNSEATTTASAREGETSDFMPVDTLDNESPENGTESHVDGDQQNCYATTLPGAVEEPAPLRISLGSQPTTPVTAPLFNSSVLDLESSRKSVDNPSQHSSMRPGPVSADVSPSTAASSSASVSTRPSSKYEDGPSEPASSRSEVTPIDCEVGLPEVPILSSRLSLASQSSLSPVASLIPLLPNDGQHCAIPAKEFCDAATSPIVVINEDQLDPVMDISSVPVDHAFAHSLARSFTNSSDISNDYISMPELQHFSEAPADNKVTPATLEIDSDEEHVEPLDNVLTSGVSEKDTIATDISCRVDEAVNTITGPYVTEKHEGIEIGIQTTPVVPTVNLQSEREDAGAVATPSPLDCVVVSSASSAVVESARSSVSRILSRHLRSEGLDCDSDEAVCFQRSMKLVEVILSDCSYVANFCLLSNYQDYHTLVPSFNDDGMIEGCVERAHRVLENLSTFTDPQVLLALSPVLIDACHVSILRLCKEIERSSELAIATDKVVEAIVALIELFTVSAQHLDGRALLQYCSVVIHCLALPKACFHSNVKLYNGLSRLISVNALGQSTDILARLLVVCLELSVQSLRRGDRGRILLAMLRLTKIFQGQIMLRIGKKKTVSTVTRSELYKSHSTYVGMLRSYMRNAACTATLETRLHDAVCQSNLLMRLLRELGV